jgi:hypothetical protein
MMKQLQGADAEAKPDVVKFVGEDTKDKQEYKKKAEEDAAAKKAREDRIKALKLLQDLLAETAVLKGKEEEELIAIRAKVAQGCRDCLALGLSEEEVRPLRDRVRKVHNMVQDLKGAIRVFCRTRPFNQREKDAQSKVCLQFSDDKMTVQIENNDGDTSKFMFDTTFNPGTQDAIFTELKELIQSVYDGYNVTVFAYGQTGSGKTFTMYGPKDNIGVVPKSIKEIMRLKNEDFGDSKTWEVTVTTSMVELYKGKFADLLYKKKEKAPEIHVKRTPDGEVLMEGSIEALSKDYEESWKHVEAGFDGRKVAATAMNSDSSRSHLFVILKVKILNKATNKEIKGKVTLVDLAGSERVKDSMVEGEALQEAIEINKSLTTLGDCMSEISKGGKNVNMRNTPLTAALADSLGGTAKTLMFANLSPAVINVNESIMTCQWAMRARKVQNKKDDSAPAAKGGPKKKAAAKRK